MAPLRQLVTSGCALLAAAALGSPAAAESSHRQSRAPVIEEFARPERGRYDKLIEQLPSLVRVEQAAKPAVAPEPPKTAAAPALVESSAAQPVALGAVAETKVERAPPTTAAEPPADLLDALEAEERAAAGARAVAPAPAVEAPALDVVVSEEQTPAPKAAPAVPAESLAPPAVAETEAESQSDLMLWAFLALGVLAVGGLLVLRQRKARGAQAFEPTPQSAGAWFAALLEKLPALAAGLRRLRVIRGGSTPASPGDANVEWSQVAAALRAKVAPASGPSREGAALTVVAETPRAESSWRRDEEESVELIEPGAVSARAIVMNARRRLRAAEDHS